MKLLKKYLFPRPTVNSQANILLWIIYEFTLCCGKLTLFVIETTHKTQFPNISGSIVLNRR